MNRRIALVLILAVFRVMVSAESVRKVDFREVPEMKELAERARQIGNEMYPKVLALLGDNASASPHQFDIVFKKRLPRQYSEGVKGVTSGSKIRLDGNFLKNNPVYLDVILIHEMAHVAQHYGWYRRRKIPTWWIEGIADYVCYKMGYTNGPRCPECSSEHPHYTSGYTCAGALLLYVDSAFGSNVVRQLNTALRQGSYTDQFFLNSTGKSIDELWVEFQKTPAFTPMAAQINILRKQLGYKNGKPPGTIRVGFEAYLRQRHSGTEIGALHDSLGYANGQPPKDVVTRYLILQYFNQPAGMVTQEAAAFLADLGSKTNVPGWSDKIWFDLIPDGWSIDFPVSRTFHGHVTGDQSLYHYLVVRESKDSDWKIKRAWQTVAGGGIAEEYPLPER